MTMTSHIEIQKIAESLGSARKEGAGWRSLCPVHIDHSPSLSLNLSSNGRLLVKCWSGCDSKRILQFINSNTGTSFISQQVSHTKSANYRQSNAAPVWVRNLWISSQPLRPDDLATSYIRNRGLSLIQLPSALRFAESCIKRWQASFGLCNFFFERERR